MVKKKTAQRTVKLDPNNLTLRVALRMLNARRLDDKICLVLCDFFKQGGWLLRHRKREERKIPEEVREMRPAWGDVRVIRILSSGNVEIFDDNLHTESEKPLVTAHLDRWERMRLRELLREDAPEGDTKSRSSSGRKVGIPLPGDLETLDWIGRVSSQISVLMKSCRSEKRSLGKMLYQSLQVLNRLARLPPPRGAYPLYLEPEELVSDLKKKLISSTDLRDPWWMKKDRYVFFRRHSRELILRASRRKEEGLRASDSDAMFVDAVRLMTGEPEVKKRTIVGEKDSARRFASQLAFAIGRRETLEEIDRWYGGLSKLGLHLEQKLGFV